MERLAMKNRVRLSVLALVLVLLVSACSTPAAKEQLRLGLWAAEQNLWDEAIFRWKKAVAADGNSVAAHNNLGIAYEKKGLFDEALKEYALALRIDPNNAAVKSNQKNCQDNLQPPKKEEPTKKNERP